MIITIIQRKGKVSPHNMRRIAPLFAATGQDTMAKQGPGLSGNSLRFDARPGLSLIFGNLPYPVMLSFTHVWRVKEFDGQEGADKFGPAQVSVQF